MVITTGRVKVFSFGLKQLKIDPWDKFYERYKAGDTITGSVFRILPYGVLLEIVSGIDALLHKSEMPVSELPEHYAIDDTFEVKIKTIDRENRKVSVSLV